MENDVLQELVDLRAKALEGKATPEEIRAAVEKIRQLRGTQHGQPKKSKPSEDLLDKIFGEGGE